MYSVILNAAQALPWHGHNSWGAPATISPDEQKTLGAWTSDNRTDVDAEVMRLLGDRGPAVKAWAEAQEAEASKGWPCSCGCGCGKRHHHSTSSYCSACRAGCCGEW